MTRNFIEIPVIVFDGRDFFARTIRRPTNVPAGAEEFWPIPLQAGMSACMLSFLSLVLPNIYAISIVCGPSGSPQKRSFQQKHFS